MAIAFDNGTLGYQATGTNPSFSSENTSATATLGIIYVQSDDSTNVPTAATWNGVSMTKVGDITGGWVETLSCWAIVNPTSGVQTIAVTASGSIFRTINSYTYTGTKTSGVPTNFGGAQTGTATEVARSVTINVAVTNSWVAGIVYNQAGSITYTVPATDRATTNAAWRGGDSNADLATGNYTITATWSALSRNGGFAMEIEAGTAIAVTNVNRNFNLLGVGQ